MKNKVKENEERKVIAKNSKGITLISLVVTIILLIILATVSVTTIFGENGMINQADNAKEKYRIEEAREKLVLVLVDAQIEKESNRDYNQEQFLDEYIADRIENVQIVGDSVIINGYAFNIDRSVPKIADYIGKNDELKFPEVATDVTYAKDYKTATITITALESENGISKIEIIQEGFILETYTYDNVKEEITETYTTNHTGEYVIKVYSLTTNKEVEKIEGLMAGIAYIPNGNEEYKKEHKVKVSVAEDTEKVASIKYQWLDTTVEPEKDTFTEEIENNGTITKDGITGKYYLWTLLETETGKSIIERSEAFYFDNEGPTVSSLTHILNSSTSLTLNATANDEHIGQISKYEFYIGDELKNTIETTETTATYTDTSLNITSNVSCYVIVTDSLGNTTKKDLTIPIYTWAKWSATGTSSYTPGVGNKLTNKNCVSCQMATCTSGSGTFRLVCFNSSTGTFSASTSQPPNLSCFKNNYIYTDGTYTCSIPRGVFYWCVTYWGRCVNFEIYYPVANTSTVYSKGSTNYGDVISDNSSAYPSNGHQSGYWYVRK